MRIGIGTAAVLLLAVVAGGVQAQEHPFGQLTPGQTVRVTTIGGSRFVTKLGVTSGDSPGPSFALADIPFEPARVDSLWVRGRAVGTGALVGAAVATPLSFAFYGWICIMVAEGTGCDAWGNVAGLALATGAGGALVGAGVGALIPKWRLRYARDGDLSISPILTPGRVGIALRF
jgi:hypothetical protein